MSCKHYLESVFNALWYRIWKEVRLERHLGQEVEGLKCHGKTFGLDSTGIGKALKTFSRVIKWSPPCLIKCSLEQLGKIEGKDMQLAETRVLVMQLREEKQQERKGSVRIFQWYKKKKKAVWRWFQVFYLNNKMTDQAISWGWEHRKRDLGGIRLSLVCHTMKQSLALTMSKGASSKGVISTCTCVSPQWQVYEGRLPISQKSYTQVTHREEELTQ